MSHNQRQQPRETAVRKSSLAPQLNTRRYEAPFLLHLKASLMMPSTPWQMKQSSEASGINSGSITFFFPVFRYPNTTQHWTSHQGKRRARSSPALRLKSTDAFRLATQRPLLSLPESPGCHECTDSGSFQPYKVGLKPPGRGARGGRQPGPARRCPCRRRAGQAWPQSRPSPPGPSARRGGGSSRRASRHIKAGGGAGQGSAADGDRRWSSRCRRRCGKRGAWRSWSASSTGFSPRTKSAWRRCRRWWSPTRATPTSGCSTPSSTSTGRRAGLPPQPLRPPRGTPGSGRHPDRVVLVVPPGGRAGAESGRGGGGQWGQPQPGLPRARRARGCSGGPGGVAPEVRGAKLCAASPGDGAVSGRFVPPNRQLGCSCRWWLPSLACKNRWILFECLPWNLQTARALPSQLAVVEASSYWSGVFNPSSSRVFSVWDKSRT